MTWYDVFVAINLIDVNIIVHKKETQNSARNDSATVKLPHIAKPVSFII